MRCILSPRSISVNVISAMKFRVFFADFFSQSKLDIFSGVSVYDLGDTKSVDSPVS